ncbi:hypothetical protein D3C81_2088460 [compost metagenome]
MGRYADALAARMAEFPQLHPLATVCSASGADGVLYFHHAGQRNRRTVQRLPCRESRSGGTRH